MFTSLMLGAMLSAAAQLPASFEPRVYDCLLFRPVLDRPNKPKLQPLAAHRVRERLDRGLVAMPAGGGRVYVGWRLLDADPTGVGFDVYRAEAGQTAVKLNPSPITNTTDFVDAAARPGAKYEYSVQAVTAAQAGKQALAAGRARVAAEAGCAVIKLDPGVTVQKVGIGDLDGDGRYDFVIKQPQDNIDPALPWWTRSPDTYTTIRLVAYQFRRGRGLEKVWSWDSREEAGRGRYNSQGAHITHAADVDGDGRDEVIVGSAVVDDNGNGLWTTGFGHPDFCFVGDIDPAHPGLEIFYGIEPRHEQNGLCLVDACMGKLLWGLQEPTTHVGTDGMCADIDGRYPGSECHAANLDAQRRYDKGWLFSAQGRLLSDKRQRTMSQPVYWDADPQRELLRGAEVCDFQGEKHPPRIAGHMVAIADVLGDWREEIITSKPGELRIYSTTIPAHDRRACLMQDPIYRIDVAVAAMGYYGAPMLSYDVASQKIK